MPKACWFDACVRGRADIIYAAGVRVAVPSFAPEACTPASEPNLSSGPSACELVAKIFEVIRTDTQMQTSSMIGRK
jgi:hypothetical protein